MTGHEIEMDQHHHATKQLSALLSAALAAAQAAAQVVADRARRQAQEHTRGARDTDRRTAQLDADARRQLDRQARAEQALRQRQWAAAPSSQWLHDNPLSAAASWADADAHRGDDPGAARHADRWEAVFRSEDIDVAEVRANAPAAVAVAEGRSVDVPQAGAAEGRSYDVDVVPELVGAGLLAEAFDVAHAREHDTDGGIGVDPVSAGPGAVVDGAASDAEPPPWTAYADGDPIAALGGRGVSTPPQRCLFVARQQPDSAVTADAATAGPVLVADTGVER